MSRERKPARRRPAERPAEILKASGQVFANKGYARATTREIAALAGVSEGTLYNYFDSKRDILLALLEETTAHIAEALAHVQGGSYEETMAQMLASRIRQAHEQPITILTLQMAMFDEEVGRAFDEMISSVQDETMRRLADLETSGDLRPVDPFVAEEAFGSMMMGLTIGAELASRGRHREPLSPEVLSRALVDVLMNGLRACPRGAGGDPGEGSHVEQ
jgi:AcrR family transcriptional regulator